MFEFPERIFWFNPSNETINIFYLQEVKDNKGCYLKEYGELFFVLEKSFKEDLFAPPCHFTLEEAQADGKRYIAARIDTIEREIEEAKEKLEFYNNHNGVFPINDYK